MSRGEVREGGRRCLGERWRCEEVSRGEVEV